MIMNAHLFVAGVFIARGKEDALVTKNLVPGESVYGEKRISVEVSKKKKYYGVLPLFSGVLPVRVLLASLVPRPLPKFEKGATCKYSRMCCVSSLCLE